MQRSETSVKQIILAVLILIYTGKLSANQRLPSVRCFAKELHVSCSSAQSIYIHLKEKGVIYSVPSKGYYVSPFKKIAENDLSMMRQCLKTICGVVDRYDFELLDVLQFMISIDCPSD